MVTLRVIYSLPILGSLPCGPKALSNVRVESSASVMQSDKRLNTFILLLMT